MYTMGVVLVHECEVVVATAISAWFVSIAVFGVCALVRIAASHVVPATIVSFVECVLLSYVVFVAMVVDVYMLDVSLHSYYDATIMWQFRSACNLGCVIIAPK